MSRLFTDDSLLTWEAYPSGGRFGLPSAPKIVFNCVSDPERRARWVRHQGDDADAQRALGEWSDSELNSLLEVSYELE